MAVGGEARDAYGMGGTGVVQPGTHGAGPAAPGDHVGSGPPPGGGPDPIWAARQRWLTAAAVTAAALVLFFLYAGQDRKLPLGSDGASIALEAWDMLHGNPLLRGWTLGDVSFYTTELPEYALVEAARGLTPGVIHVAAALTYTLAVLLAALLAKGAATGRAGWTRAAIAAGIMAAPTWNGLLSNPDHTGTQVPVLLTWLIVDRARPRWWVPVAVAALLAWTQVADAIAVYECALPLAAVCAVRLYRRAIDQRPGLWDVPGWLRANAYELSLGLAAVLSVPVASLALRLIAAAGGFTVPAPRTTFAFVDAIPSHVGVTAESVLQLYSADFSGEPLRLSIVALLHLAGLALAAWAVARAYRRFWDQDLMVQAVAVCVAVLLIAYTVAGTPSVGGGTHEIIGLLPAGAVLAGRLLGPALVRARLLPLLAAVLACCLAVLAHYAVQPLRSPSSATALGAWLRASHLDYGLADYWTASAVTVATGDRVRLRPVTMQDHRVGVSPWESDSAWYDPRAQDARFIIVPTVYTGCSASDAALLKHYWQVSIRDTFGPPDTEHRVDGFTVLIWRHNLLGSLRALPSAGPLKC